jgi:hypothetical protein
VVGVIEAGPLDVCTKGKKVSPGEVAGMVVDSKFDVRAGKLVRVECGGNVDFASEAEQDARATARNIHVKALRRSFMFYLITISLSKKKGEACLILYGWD